MDQTDVHIPHCKYQVKPHSSTWFLLASAVAAIVQRNNFCRLYQQNKSYEPKVKFRQGSNSCKRVEGAKLAYATKTKGLITSQKLDSLDFCQIANSVLNIGKSTTILPLFDGPDVLPSASDKQTYWLKTFLKTLFLMTRVSLYLFSLLEVI